jgi:AraC-like DNA-binding protein
MDRRAISFEQTTPSSTARGVEPAVLAAAATGIVKWIERSKGDVDRIFGNSGLSPDMAGQATLALSLPSFCKLMEQSAKLTHNDNFALWFGNQFEARDLGLWGYGAISAPTVGSALDVLVELFPYHQQSSTLRVSKEPSGLMRIDYRVDAPHIVERRQDAELTLGNILNVMREGLGSHWAPEEVHFEHPKPDGWRDHERAFQAPVFFSQRTNAILFRPDVMRTPMPAADARLLAAMRMCMEKLWQGEHKRAGITDRVRIAIRAQLPDGAPELEDIATELRLSVGAIQRELNRDGLNFKTLVEQTRRDLAMAYLQRDKLPLSEIALLLGYSELSAFSRAVRRWTGTSPRGLRNAILGGHEP